MRQSSTYGVEQMDAVRSGLWEFARGRVLIPTTASSAVVGVVMIWETCFWLVVPAMKPLLLLRIRRSPPASGPTIGSLRGRGKTV
jgi:hypothetical protein